MRAILVFCFACVCLPEPVVACGPESDCEIAGRSYRIDRPQQALPGALIFAHGYRGSAAGSMRNKGLRRIAHEAGLAFVAAEAADDRGWMIPNRPRNRSNDGRLEFHYFDALIDDLVTRHGVDPDRIVMAGFSAGGMMTWELACNRGDRFRGLIAVAGTFWAPVPARCPNPAKRFVHIHGTSDEVVPLRGRAIADTRQGNVFASLDLLHRAKGFGIHREFSAGELGCMRQVDGDGGLLTFCTHSGGHSVKTGWMRTALDLILAD